MPLLVWPSPDCASPAPRRRARVAATWLLVLVFAFGWIAVGPAELPLAPGALHAWTRQEPAAAAEQVPGVSPEHASQLSRQSLEGAPVLDMIARLLNFAVLAGLLVWLLRSPLAVHLKERSAQIRADLEKSAATREQAQAELEEVERRLKALPGEIEELRERGAREIAAEEARIREAAATERERLLEHARSEIERHLKVARRGLLRETADLAVRVASGRIRRSITPADQQRLVDRYLQQVSS